MAGPRVLVNALVIIALQAGMSAPAHADRASRARARELFKQGQAHYDGGAFGEALPKFEAALKLINAPNIILAIAQCHRQLGHDEQALERYREYLTAWQERSPKKASPYAEEVKQHVAMLEERLRARDAAEQAAAAERRRREEEQRRAAAQRQAPAAPPTAKPPLPPPPEQPQPSSGRGRRMLLISAITGAALAVGGGVVGGVFNVKANNAGSDDEFETSRSVSIAGYVMAGVFGAAAATCGVLYFLSRSGEKPTPHGAAAAIAPTAGGAAFFARVPF